MLTLFKKKQRVKLNVGIDIGSAFIKAVVIDKGKIAPKLAAFSYQPATEDKIGSVKKIMSQFQISDISVNTSISGPSTIVRVIEMPKMTGNELKSAVKFEAEKYMPYKLDEVVTDCVNIEDLDNSKIRVLLVAAKKSTVGERIELLSEAGLTLGIVDIDSFAVMNAFLNSQREKNKDTTYALINIGAKTTNINIIRGEKTYLVRDIQIAGNDVTQAIADRLNIEKGKAETLKINPADLKNEIEPIVKSIFYNLSNEIRLSFDFYENHYGKNVQKVYISGGSSGLEGISTLLKDIFIGDVISWDPFNGIEISEKVDTAALKPIRSSFAVAVGLGLRDS